MRWIRSIYLFKTTSVLPIAAPLCGIVSIGQAKVIKIPLVQKLGEDQDNHNPSNPKATASINSVLG